MSRASACARARCATRSCVWRRSAGSRINFPHPPASASSSCGATRGGLGSPPPRARASRRRSMPTWRGSARGSERRSRAAAGGSKCSTTRWSGSAVLEAWRAFARFNFAAGNCVLPGTEPAPRGDSPGGCPGGMMPAPGALSDAGAGKLAGPIRDPGCSDLHPNLSERCSSALALCAVVVFGLAPMGGAGVLAPFQESAVITGLTNPTAVRFAPDGRIFVAEQSGLLKVFNGLGDNTADIAVDLRTKVMNNWDRGFLGLAIDPQFPAPGHDYVYVLYTVDAPPGQNPPVWNDGCSDQTTNGCVTRGRLSRVRIAANNTQIGSEEVLVDDRWCFQFASHSIGDLHFGPEGALYVTGGEGASFTFIDYG